MGLPDGEEIDASFLRFDTIPARDRQTDRRTDRHVAVAKTRASIASRGKNLLSIIMQYLVANSQYDEFCADVLSQLSQFV